MLALDISIGFDLMAVVILVVIAVAVVGVYLWWIGGAIFKKPLTGAESLLGKQGKAVTELTRDKDGEVSVDGIIWNARLSGDFHNVSKGDSVVVAEVSSLTLIVKPLKSSS